MKQIGLRIPDELYEWLRKHCFDHRTPLNTLVKGLIETHKGENMKTVHVPADKGSMVRCIRDNVVLTIQDGDSYIHGFEVWLFGDLDGALWMDTNTALSLYHRVKRERPNAQLCKSV